MFASGSATTWTAAKPMRLVIGPDATEKSAAGPRRYSRIEPSACGSRTVAAIKDPPRTGLPLIVSASGRRGRPHVVALEHPVVAVVTGIVHELQRGHRVAELVGVDLEGDGGRQRLRVAHDLHRAHRQRPAAVLNGPRGLAAEHPTEGADLRALAPDHLQLFAHDQRDEARATRQRTESRDQRPGRTA